MFCINLCIKFDVLSMCFHQIPIFGWKSGETRTPTQVARHHPHPGCLETYAAGDGSAGDSSGWCSSSSSHMGVSMNGGAPLWMVYAGKYHLQMDNLGAAPIMETSIRSCIFPYTLLLLSSLGYSPCSHPHIRPVVPR